MSAAKLDMEYDFSFDLLGIVSTAREHKLAWLLNRLLGISFVRRDPVAMPFSSGMVLHIGVFDFATENDAYQLLRNRALEASDAAHHFLLPELKEYDYLLRVDNLTGLLDVAGMREAIAALPEVQYCARIELEGLKSRENLLF
jgi:hypothetical protein